MRQVLTVLVLRDPLDQMDHQAKVFKDQLVLLVKAFKVYRDRQVQYKVFKVE